MSELQISEVRFQIGAGQRLLTGLHLPGIGNLKSELYNLKSLKCR
jgi:hypothetical protein